MRTTLITLALVLAMSAGGMANEPTYNDDGSCLDEITGEPGLRGGDGTCTTPAEYDERFSYEALAQLPSRVIPGVSVAEIYNITVDSPSASERLIGVGVLEPGTEVTFVDAIGYVSAAELFAAGRIS